MRIESELHASLKELEARVKDIEYRLNAITEFPRDLDIRLQECERLLDNWADKIVGKKPHKCPVCEGKSHTHHVDDKIKETKNFGFYREYASCYACEGTGIVWG